jgi:UDP-N-acetyl-D-mannosaminuronic acid dehydrogenase
MQLAAFNDNNFALGHAAMLVNEGLPLYVVSQLADEHDLSTCTVGILGASFKAGSDDTRSSLAYKLKRIVSFKARRVLMTDPYVTTDPTLVPLEQVLDEADVLIVATPHAEYRDIVTDKPVADVWNVIERRPAR